MKQTIKVKLFTPECKISINDKGDFIDLKAAKDIILDAPYANALHKSKSDRYRYVEFNKSLIPLGVALQLPKGMKAVVVPRSSSHKYFNIIQANSVGIIDQSYCGGDDQWYMPVITIGKAEIKKGDRICQFEIQPSMKATVWQKLKWLFSNGIKLEVVKEFYNKNRGGIGSTGKQ